MLTQEKLKRLLSYNPEIGLFIWLKSGEVAGKDDGRGHLYLTIKSHIYRVHRLAFLYMTGKWPKKYTDHINHIRDDNRWLNLREATDGENQKNSSQRKDNTSGITGVGIHKQSGKWQARIKLDSKLKHLGLFDDKFEAIYSRKSASNKYGFHENHGNKLSDIVYKNN